jgi:hypothetical protein
MTTDIFEAIKDHNIVLKWNGGPHDGMKRLAVELFPYKDGAVFFDVGWTESSGHPIHVLPGPIISDESQWGFGDIKREGFVTAYVFDPELFPDLVGNHETWKRYLQHEDGKHATTEWAYEIFKRHFLDVE